MEDCEVGAPMRIPNFQGRVWPMLKGRKKATRTIRQTLPDRVKTKRSLDEAKLTRLSHHGVKYTVYTVIFDLIMLFYYW